MPTSGKNRKCLSIHEKLEYILKNWFCPNFSWCPKNLSLSLRCVRTSRMDFFLDLPLYTHISRKVISVSEISAVNFMVVLDQLLLEKPQENETSRPKTNNSRITHTSGDKSRVTCIQVFTYHISFLSNFHASSTKRVTQKPFATL